MENSVFDTFYHNHPLAFISRRPSEQKLKGASISLSKARDLILNKVWEQPEDRESELGMLCAECLYMFGTGNYNFEDFDMSDITNQIRNLTASTRLSEKSCGLISDVDIEQRRQLVKLTNADVQKSSLHQLMRFCYSHGMYVGHDIEPDEIKSMARCIIRNEKDGVTFSQFSTMMQQAIDLSVFSQYTTHFAPDERSSLKLQAMARNCLKNTMEMNQEQTLSQHEAGKLLNVVMESVDRKAVADFQSKVLQFHMESHLEKKSANNTQDEDVDSINDN